MRFRVGTRGSRLAVAQTDIIIEMLRRTSPDADFEKVRIKTKGDKIKDVALAKIGGKGLFTKELDEALLRSEIDFAVHSMKDVPTEMTEGLEIASVPKRERIEDVLISRDFSKLEELPYKAKVGTSSLRRRAEVLNSRPDIEVCDLRGNVDTRIRKALDGDYDAIIMAEAGLRRLGREVHVTARLPPKVFLPSVGQGAIAVVAKEGFGGMGMLKGLEHGATRQGVEAERALLARLGGGCQVPVGALTRVRAKLKLKAAILSPDGKRKVVVEHEGAPGRSERVGREAAEVLLKEGGEEILKEVYGALE